MRIYNVLLISIFCLVFSLSYSQNSQKAIVESTKAEYLGKTSPVKDLIKLQSTSKDKKALWKKQNKKPKNFIGRGPSKVVKPELEHQGVDKLRQGIIMNSTKMTDANLIVNIDGITNDSPNDPTGDIGKDHYLQAVNATNLAVYDKDGTQLSTFTANTLWQEIGFASAGDPIVLYDQEKDRWIITEFPSGNQLLVAISEDSDPTGAYDVYNFQTPNFPDYPKYGIWKDAITVTTNEGGPGTLTVYLINKQQLYGAKDQVDIQRISLPGNSNIESGFFAATPVDWMGQTEPADDNPIFLSLNDSSWGDVDEDQVNVFSIDIDWFNPDNTSFINTPIITAPYDSYPCSVEGVGFSCVPQGGNGGGLDGLPDIIMNQAVYRNFLTHESMVFNFITDVTDGDNLSGIRWVELRRTNGSAWSLYQEGTFSPDDGLDRYMAGIAMDASGNIGLAYNVSSEEEFVGVRFTGRKWDDELGEMTIPEQEIVAGTNTISGPRFGDYAQMGVDPVDDKTFWYVTEYGGGGGITSTTRIAAFVIDRDSIDVGVSKMVTEKIGGFENEEAVTVRVNNFGTSDVSDVEVSYVFNNGTVVNETIEGTLLAGDNIEYTFAEKITFPAAGPHPFLCYTNFENDQVLVNDSLEVTLTKISLIDIGITSLDLGTNIICDTSITAQIKLFNFGANTLTSATIEFFIDDILIQTELWEGTLDYCKSDILSYEINNLAGGLHTLQVVISNPNEIDDEDISNNNLSFDFEVLEDGLQLTLSIFTDEYPEETTWEMFDEQGNLIASGGPYINEEFLYQETVCVKEDDCYEFFFYDSFGDGLYEPGTYSITNGTGAILTMLINPDFGTVEQTSFCASSGCALSAVISTTPASSIGGTILITPTNGVGPFMYSIDGGDTFQDSGLFEDVPEGEYNIVVQGAQDCYYEGEAEVEACTLQVTFEVDHVQGQVQGAINVTAFGGVPPYEYSIDGGVTWQNSTLFNLLDAAEYEVLVRDAEGCLFTENVEVKSVDAITSTQLGTIFTSTPNPTQGDFKLYLEGNTDGRTFIKFQIFNEEGKIIRHSTLVRYDSYYTAEVSLHYEAAGVYYVRIIDAGLNKMMKVVKL